MSKPYSVDDVIRDLTRGLLAVVVVATICVCIWLTRSLW